MGILTKNERKETEAETEDDYHYNNLMMNNGMTEARFRAQHDNSKEQRHEQFVAALDRLDHGMMMMMESSSAMDHLATTLGWTRTEVEYHAYQYMMALTEVSEEEYGLECARERRQMDSLTRNGDTNNNNNSTTSNNHPQIQHSPGTWTPGETRLLQTLLVSMGAVEGDSSSDNNLLNRLARFFPKYSTLQLEHQINYLLQRKRLAESMDE